MKNFHLPLPDHTYDRLRSAASESGTPASALAREAIEAWLKARAKDERNHALARFAKEAAGSQWDLDPALEGEAAAHLASSVKPASSGTTGTAKKGPRR